MRSWWTSARLLNFNNSLGRRCEKDYNGERYKIVSSPCSSASTCAQSMINKKTLLYAAAIYHESRGAIWFLKKGSQAVQGWLAYSDDGTDCAPTAALDKTGSTTICSAARLQLKKIKPVRKTWCPCLLTYYNNARWIQINKRCHGFCIPTSKQYTTNSNTARHLQFSNILQQTPNLSAHAEHSFQVK